MSRHRLTVLWVLASVLGSGAVPVHPGALDDKLQPYVAARIGEFGEISGHRRQQLQKIAAYVRDADKLNPPARLTFICTHNSRRSQLCQIWAATAAAYYGVPHVEAYSGGTQVTAFNSRAVGALIRAGFTIEAAKGSQNARRRVRYRADGPALDCFSKVYSDSPNPKANFCAVMTCSVADKQCPIVEGASLRVSLPFDDPKDFDGTPQETQKYDERCRQIARELLYLFSEVQGVTPAELDK